MDLEQGLGGQNPYLYDTEAVSQPRAFDGSVLTSTRRVMSGLDLSSAIILDRLKIRENSNDVLRYSPSRISDFSLITRNGPAAPCQRDSTAETNKCDEREQASNTNRIDSKRQRGRSTATYIQISLHDKRLNGLCSGDEDVSRQTERCDDVQVALLILYITVNDGTSNQHFHTSKSIPEQRKRRHTLASEQTTSSAFNVNTLGLLSACSAISAGSNAFCKDENQSSSARSAYVPGRVDDHLFAVFAE